MSLEIYDGQRGTKIFPYSPTENEKIKRFFNDNIDFYIEKEDDNISIYLKIYIIEDKLEIFYIVYSDKNSKDYFSRFKEEIDKTFLKLDLKPVLNKDTDNIIFRNIQLFYDQSVESPFEDIDDIIYLINKRKHLGFKAGKINDVIAFCREVLKNPNNESISISTGGIIVDVGNVNILLDENFDTPFTLTDDTQKMLTDRKQELADYKKEEVRQQAKDKIRQGFDAVTDGFTSIIQGMDDMTDAGYTISEIKKDPDIMQLRTQAMELDRLSLIGGGKKAGINNTIAAILVFLILGIVVGIVVQPYLSVGKGGVEPTVTAVPTPQTVAPTPNITVVPTETAIVVQTLTVPIAPVVNTSDVNSSDINTTINSSANTTANASINTSINTSG